MSGGLRSLLRDLTGRNDGHFVRLLCDQLACGLQAVVRLRAAVEGHAPLETVVDDIADIEDRADRHRDELIEELGQALTTPLDREDLFRLSRSLDDIVDNLRDFADALVRFHVTDVSTSIHAMEAIEGGLHGLGDAVELLVAGPKDVASAARSAKQRTRVRQAYLDGLVAVFEGEDCAEMLKQRELLRRLDVVGLRFGEAADTLADGALKRA